MKRFVLPWITVGTLIGMGVLGACAYAQQPQESVQEQLMGALAQQETCTAALNAAIQSSGRLGAAIAKTQAQIKQLEAQLKEGKEADKPKEAKP